MTQSIDNYIYDKSKPILNQRNYTVYQAINSIDKNNVYICFLINKNFDQQLQSGRRHQEFQFIVKQIQKIKDLKHPNVTKILQIIKKTNDQFIFITQYCQYGSIIDYLKKQKFFDQRFSVYILYQICIGLRQLHKLGILHGYINLENIQIDNQGVFKLSVRCLILKAFYLSPQYKLERNRQKSGDIFSLGIAFYKMMYGVFPFEGKSNEQMLNNIKKQQRRSTSVLNIDLPFQIYISKQIQNLVFKMISYDRQNRPFLEDIIIGLEKRLNDNDEKLKRFPKQVQDEYFIFNYKQTIQHDKYYRQLIFTCIRKQNKQIRKLKVIPLLNKQPKQMEIVHKFISKLSFLKQSTINGQKYYIKNSFLSVKQHFLTNNSLIIIHQYFNQTYLQQYINNRSKLSPIKQNQTNQIIFYVTQALKLYNQAVGPHGWLSTKNIYIRQGIIKIGLPCVQFQNIKKLIESMKSNIDYLSPEKKQNKKLNQKTDIWSLGVLKYGMTFNKYPSFSAKLEVNYPNNVDITVQSKSYINSCLRINVNQRGSFSQIELSKPRIEKICTYYGIDKQQAKKLMQTNNIPLILQTQVNDLNVVEQQQIVIQNMNKIQNYLYNKISHSYLYKRKFYLFILDNTNIYIRILIKNIVAFFLFIILFYLTYLELVNSLIRNKNKFISYTIPLYLTPNDNQVFANYTLTSLNPDFFISQKYTFFQIRDQINCARDLYFNPVHGGIKKQLHTFIQSNQFLAFEVLGIFLILFNLILKLIQSAFMDIPKIMKQIHEQPTQINQFLRYIYIQFAISCSISFHYLIFGSLYHMQAIPCLSNPMLPSLKFLFSGKINYYLISLLGIFISYAVIIILCLKDRKFKINKFIYLGLFILYLIGIGVRGFGGFVYNQGINNGWISICGLIPEILVFIVICISECVDIGFWCFAKYRTINKKHKLKAFQLQSGQSSMTETQL